ncbi:MAG: hypothetical protein BJG00_014140 [Limnothrix sp. CACIAM 69d]|nr:MAG: hypothetical protein BJG00_014140 [Limnothrix sp. CACIAM 69d]
MVCSSLTADRELVLEANGEIREHLGQLRRVNGVQSFPSLDASVFHDCDQIVSVQGKGQQTLKPPVPIEGRSPWALGR